jgi:hypothetical protein
VLSLLIAHAVGGVPAAFGVVLSRVFVRSARSSARTLPLFERTIEKSSQVAVRWIVVLVFALRAWRRG